jgi:rhamnopyranosyl-N-acetylglucosaminyl-diphospho-decaprenol beta-1,3/1,4-galactofuranosyltransferase
MQGNRVCAIVPTYNRKELLTNCLKAMLRGTVVPETIIVVDNASTDGTKEHIESLFAKEIEQGKIIYISLKENMGCAGGLAAGLEKGMEMDVDFFWLMNDDTEPTENALLELLKRADQKTCVASIATDRNKQELSLGLGIRIDNKVKIFQFLSEIPEHYILETSFAPFVGMLVPANIVSNIGFPRTDYFIWGDDVEYVHRMRKNGYKVKYVRESIVFHPIRKKVSVDFLWRKNIVIIDEADWKQYYAIRNHIYLYSRHKDWRNFIRSVIYYFLVWKTRGCKLNTLHFYIKGLWHGIIGKLGRCDEIMPRT